MRCPYCHANDDKVIDSRATEGGKAIRRRRVCKHCDKRFTTYEHVEQTVRLFVVKKDGSRVPYDRARVVGGLQKAAYKRPISPDQLQDVADELEEDLFRRGEREIDAAEIGRFLVERLKRIDHVAYLRFASVYLRITNIDDLLEEMRDVRNTSPPPGAQDQGALF